jgi:ABC-type iron transport system FetAB ATPase subunit
MPFSLDIEPLSAELASKAAASGRDAGIAEALLQQPVAALTAVTRLRAQLARAIALNPSLLILEHPTAAIDVADRRAFGQDVHRVASSRRLATLIISEDDEFSSAAAERRLRLNGATGALKARRRLFGF